MKNKAAKITTVLIALLIGVIISVAGVKTAVLSVLAVACFYSGRGMVKYVTNEIYSN